MGSAQRILVIDDNRSLVKVIEGILTKEGYEVLTAFDGHEGLQKAVAEKPDLVILDIVMPKADGYEVCRLLHDNPATETIPVLMLTVKGQVDEALDKETLGARYAERRMGFDVGALDFMNKPVKANELLEAVKKLIWHIPA